MEMISSCKALHIFTLACVLALACTAQAQPCNKSSIAIDGVERSVTQGRAKTVIDNLVIARKTVR